MPTIESIVKPRGSRISVAVPKEYASYSFQVILVPIRPEEPSGAKPAPRSARQMQSLADALLSLPSPGDDWSPDASRADDPPSFFERSGGFCSEAFA
ncbi:MAG: hypothetical protein IJS32_07620 [Kiritimatiellae bacterium]|nr:hypothetical protein [Kiritimatiellia bacterium]